MTTLELRDDGEGTPARWSDHFVAGPRPTAPAITIGSGSSGAAATEAVFRAYGREGTADFVVLETPNRAGIEDLFHQLAGEWQEERGPMSGVSEVAMLPSYQRIIGLGPAVIPLLLKELQERPDHWFWALNALTRADPIPEESYGRLNEMAQAWIQWGEREGHC